jgi:type VI secretion system protein ImpA
MPGGIQGINRVIEEKFDRNRCRTSNLKKALDEFKLSKKLLEENAEERTRDDARRSRRQRTNNSARRRHGQKQSPRAGAIQNSRDAIKRLADLAEYFRKTEPHSPVSYLVTRAVKWGEMPLEMWLQDVIKDESVLFQLRQTLGFNTNSANSNGATPGAVDTSGAVRYE